MVHISKSILDCYFLLSEFQIWGLGCTGLASVLVASTSLGSISRTVSETLLLLSESELEVENRMRGVSESVADAACISITISEFWFSGSTSSEYLMACGVGWLSTLSKMASADLCSSLAPWSSKADIWRAKANSVSKKKGILKLEVF